MRKRKASSGNIIYMSLVYLILYIPILILIIFSFNNSKTNAIWNGFTFKWYFELLKNTSIIEATKNSLIIAVISTILSVMLGTVASFGMYKHKFKGKSVLDNLLFIPIVIPEIVLGISLLVLFSKLSLAIPWISSGIVTLVIAHITFSVSYVYFVVRGRLESFDINLEEAALDLGCTPIQAFFKVTLPVILPGIISGAMLAFTLSLDDVIISFFVAGPDVTTLPLKVFSMVKLGVSPEINALSTILMIMTIIVVLLTNAIQKNKVNKKKTMALTSIFMAFIIMFMGGIFYLSNKNSEEGKNGSINVFNWSEYIPQDVITDFQKESGIKVNYSVFSSNEEMLSKLVADKSQYDLVVASDYMVEILRERNLVEKMDYANIPNYKNISENNKSLSFDPKNQYTVPYMWNIACIAVNTELINVDIKNYSDLWDPSLKNSLVVLNDQRAMVGMALMKNGYMLNETDDKALKIAESDLKKLKPNIKAYDSDSPKTLLINGEAAAAYTWGPEIALAQRENPNIKAIIPTDGVMLQQDNFININGTKKTKEINKFIDFILRPDISIRISKSFPYGNPNMAAYDKIDEDIKNNIAVYPPENVIKNGQYLQNIGIKSKKIDAIWNRVKQ